MDTCFEPSGPEGRIRDRVQPAEAGAAVQRLQSENRRLRRLLELQNRDRQLIGYEIHDGLAQELSSALMQFQAFQCGGDDAGRLDWNTFTQGLEQLRASLRETRQLVAGLRPIGAEGSLGQSLRELAQRLETGGALKIELECEGDLGALSAALKDAIFRIVQEGIANARRHSKSDHMRIALRRGEGAICLSLQDWGIGFAPDKIGNGHYGLEGIRRRAELFGGRAEILSAPGAGVHIEIALPLAQA